jgi:acyl carrier protein
MVGGQGAKFHMADVEKKVLGIIAAKAKVDPASLSRATDLSTLDLDSLDVVEIFFEIDEAFDISLPFNANEASAAGARFRMAGDVIDLVAQHVSGGAA